MTDAAELRGVSAAQEQGSVPVSAHTTRESAGHPTNMLSDESILNLWSVAEHDPLKHGWLVERAVLEKLRVDAKRWRDYKARKDAVIAAGMGRNPLRGQGEPTC